MAALGGLDADETRTLLLVFDVPSVAALVVAEVLTLELTFVDLPSSHSSGMRPASQPLFGEHGTDEVDDGRPVREDADCVGAAPALKRV